MFGQEEINKHNIAQQRHLMSMFGDDSVEKALTQEEFNDKYGTDHQIFSQENIENYQVAIAEKIEENPEAADSVIEKAIGEFESLQKVLVKSDLKVETFYIKKNEETSEEGESTEETI